MCWSIEASLIAAAYGYAVSAYLYHRKYSARDPWYCAFLATFTTTQLFDAWYWYLLKQAGPGAKEVPCTTSNHVLSPVEVPRNT